MPAFTIQEWRNAWVEAFVGDEAAKKEYNGKRDFYYGAFECYYRQRTNQDGPYRVQERSGTCTTAKEGAAQPEATSPRILYLLSCIAYSNAYTKQAQPRR